ncbi:MAG: hypothetical protein LBJ64_03095 [Deltaproteobacteria bacterium]|nr:hypothetical protein [Deltaproteobacteria bacterium]
MLTDPENRVSSRAIFLTLGRSSAKEEKEEVRRQGCSRKHIRTNNEIIDG